jgi:hypothetical protein
MRAIATVATSVREDSPTLLWLEFSAMALQFFQSYQKPDCDRGPESLSEPSLTIGLLTRKTLFDQGGMH